jgi:GNAT superfamily N-acetyltransferase
MDSPDFYISTATSADRESLLRLHKDSRHQTDHAIVPEYADATKAAGYYEKLWRERFPEKDIVVLKATARGDDRLLGFCAFGRPYAAEYPEEYPDKELGAYKSGLAELHQLYVAQEFHNHGVGQALYRAALNRLKELGYRHLMIAALEGNNRAQTFL